MITINKTPNKTNEYAYNNQVYEFKGDENKTPVRATWQVIKGVDNIRQGEIVSNQGKFYVNLKKPVSNLINQDNFKDDILPTSSNYIRKDNRLIQELNHQFNVIYNDGTSDTSQFDKSYFKAVQNLFDTLEVENTVFKPLLNSNYLNYFQGVPFDISFYSDEQREVTITNQRTGITKDLTFQKGVNRLFISAGDSSSGFESQLPLLENIVNVLTFENNTGDLLSTIQVYKHPFCQAPYLKWFNKKGAWSYMQFERVFQENTNTTNRDLLFNDVENVEETISNFQTTGKTGSLNQSFETKVLGEVEAKNFLDIYTSPKVFYYAGVRNQPFELRDWKEVVINQNNVQTENTKLINRRFNVNIELPNLYTQRYE